MSINVEQIKQAYQTEHLNEISKRIIQTYKNNNYPLLYEIANNCGISEESSPFRIFGKIMQIFHPDKSQLILDEINTLIDSMDLKSLESFTHIFKVEKILKDPIKIRKPEVEFEYEEAWEDSHNEQFQFFDDTNANSKDDFLTQETPLSSYNFYEAIQLREYGDLSKTFPSYYLEDIDEFELASSQINSLEGAEFCKHAKIMDLSDNSISDLSELFELQSLEELYLAHNELSYIDTLSNLTQLKSLDLSFNLIDDISPLFSLENLEYVNLIGNPVSQTEIELLKLKSINVVL
jgi:Leucine-rich repeat (LRR) protein